MLASTAAFDNELGARLLSRAQALCPLLEHDAPLSELAGELTPKVVAALDEAELFNMAVPRRWGGPGVSAAAIAAVYFALGRACPSTGWVVSIINTCLWLVSRMSAQVQRTIFSAGLTRVCSCAGAPGKIVAEGGQFVVDGTWSYASGSHHANWTIAPVVSPEGVFSMALLPMQQLRIENTWKVAGMKATGSDSIVAKRVLISGDHFCSPAQMAAGETGKTGERFDEPSDYFMAIPTSRAQAIMLLAGIVQGLLDAVVPGANKALLNTTYSAKRDSQAYQSRLGEAAAKICAARTIVERSLERNDAAAAQRRLPELHSRIEQRGEDAVATKLLTEAADQLMTLGGSSVFYESHPAQRYWRDFSVAVRHIVFNVDLGYEIMGRELLGVTPAIMRADLV